MPMTIKIPIDDVEKRDVCEKVRETLEADTGNAYTIMGIMVEGFDVDKDEIEGKPFSQWTMGRPTLYGRIRRCLDRFIGEGLVNSAKYGKGKVYWCESTN